MHARVMNVCVGSRRPSAVNDRVFGVVNVAGVAQLEAIRASGVAPA